MHGLNIIGHRGWGPTLNDSFNLYPENTMAAFAHAMEEGADGIELDVLLSKDGIPVVIHDRHLERHVIPEQAGLVQNRKVSEFTFDELRFFDLGNNQKIPSLGELLAFMRANFPKTIVNLDVKDTNLVGPVSHEIKKSSSFFTDKNIIISSYDWDLLRLFRQRDKRINLVPAIKSALLFGEDNVRPSDFFPMTDIYQDGIDKTLKSIQKELNCIAFDCSVTDLKQPLIELAAEYKVGLQISTSNTRIDADNTDYSLLMKLKRASQDALPFVICKVDEPGLVKERLISLENSANGSRLSHGFVL